jgi:hypothetical protein
MFILGLEKKIYTHQPHNDRKVCFTFGAACFFI